MRFTRLELLNWDIQANQVIVFKPGVNLLTGENGAGKTTVLDAIKVVLGSTRIGGDRSYEDYLAPRSAPVAMIRLVADNPPDPETRRRPFDRVQGGEHDLVTLAVVFEASDEGYTPTWYLHPGDLSPLTPGFEGRPFKRAKDYRDRLDRLGMGASFRRLLCTPQGDIAGLCKEPPERLFDLLFDFIGGKQVLDEWERLRKDFERQRRARDKRGHVLTARRHDLERLRDLERAHARYREHVDRLDLARRALPKARLYEARRDERRLQSELTSLRHRRDLSLERAHAAASQLRRLTQELQAAKDHRTTLQREHDALHERHRALVTEHADHRAEWKQLDALRQRAQEIPPRDLADLTEQLRVVHDALADLRRDTHHLDQAAAALREELERLEQGLLTPPDGVDTFRAVLRTHDIPHHLLMELLEPTDCDPDTRRALESYLGDVRFAVAVPDVPTFVRAIALARDHAFPYYVLAPDVRSPAPSQGEHPFLSQIHVIEQRYRGLLNRVLRHVRWLQGPVQDTLRERGVVQVDAQGFVLDRKGGRFQGTDRYYLGRDALERRREQLQAELGQVAQRQRDLTKHSRTEARRREELQEAMRQEGTRQRWLGALERHAHLDSVLASLRGQLETLAEETRAKTAALEQVNQGLQGLAAQVASSAADQKHATAQATAQDKQLRTVQQSVEAARTALALASEQAGPADPQAEAFAQDQQVELLEHIQAQAARNLRGFSEAEQDPNLPGNVRTLAKQVEDVEGELTRLQETVDAAEQAAERAHDAYKRATGLIFKTYFAALVEAAGRLGFRIDGRLQPREDGRYAARVRVAAGDKDLVSYMSQGLSGGQKAALSILMAMTTLRVGQDQGAGFFLIDEPFSASDTTKIQELGAFLERTGAQYLVSMPTTEELRRCGPWLQAVLTCTKSPGGRTPDGSPRIAPPITCSYVVRGD